MVLHECAGVAAGKSNLIVVPFVKRDREIKECAKTPIIFTC